MMTAAKVKFGIYSWDLQVFIVKFFIQMCINRHVATCKAVYIDHEVSILFNN